ncbi:hypothetical protein HS960_09880 [Sphingobacterium paramultivorum]|uniref:Uncharacterized protein n=1 Tax=Sphingobacterium paramultivorum TaxID=2886510 RepID=A0A7G5E1S2_9SPHI|nr:hypothetical protein [Sphingobacterium paramultivorum]QMV67947.1 hypothetical protein HS960_09880 [Sphingobacterium paramultivorum]WSO16847.1 hypothetical protein VUL84_09870 [Sphingobacterium paramultivorum]
MSFKRRLNDELQQEFFGSDNNTFPAGNRVYRLKVQQPTVQSSANSHANVATI